MQALVLSRYGGPEHTALTDVPQPSPWANELLVHVHTSGLNPVDFKTRIGKLKIIRNYPLPVVMGNELSGVVEAVLLRMAGEKTFRRGQDYHLHGHVEAVEADHDTIRACVRGQQCCCFLVLPLDAGAPVAPLTTRPFRARPQAPTASL